MLQLWPRSIENRAALRTAIATLIATLISFKFHLDTPYWSGMTVVIVSNLYTGSIIDKAMMRIIGTIAGAFLGFYVAGIVANSFLLYFLSCFLIICISVYYYNYSKYGYAYLLGALCAFIVISQLALNPHNAFYVAIWRPVEIGIGVLIAAISAYTIFPNHLKDSILKQVQDIFSDFIAEFNQLGLDLKQDKHSFSDLAKTNLKIKKKTRKAVELIGFLNKELGVTKEKTDELRAFLDAFQALSREIQFLMLSVPKSTDKDFLQNVSLDFVFLAIQHDLEHLKEAFLNPSMEPKILETASALVKLNKMFNKEHYSVKSNFIYSLVHFLEQINNNLTLMHSLLSGITVKIVPSYKVLSQQKGQGSDLDMLKQGIKAGLSVILALSFWMISNWPGGLSGIISSLVISIRNNLYEMKNVSMHRIVGCFLGGGVAIFSLAAFEMDLIKFSILLFFMVWAFSYFTFYIPKYAYIGTQANLALIISLAQQGGPPQFLDPPLQRLGGILIGIAASFLVANVLWRSDVWTILKRYLSKLNYFILFNMRQVLLASKKEKSLHDLASLFWISRGIIESLGQEHLAIKKQNKLKILTTRFERLVIIQATLSHILVSINRERAEESAAALGFNVSKVAEQIVFCYEQANKEEGGALSSNLKQFLETMDKKPEYFTENYGDLRNMLAYINALNQLALRV